MNYFKGMKLIDLVMMVSAFALAAWIAHYKIDQVPFEELVTMRMKIQNFILFMSIGWVWQWVFSAFGLYQPNRFLALKYVTFDVLKATTAGTLIVFIDGNLFDIELITPTFIGLFWVTSTVLGISSRLLFSYLFNKFWRFSNSELTDGIRSKKAFLQIIEKERIRADRDNHKYSILLFSQDVVEQNDNDLRVLLQTITDRVRKIDEIGWYDKTRVGVILPYTSIEGACRLADNICESMENVSQKPSCDIYTYPFDKQILNHNNKSPRKIRAV